MGVEQEGAGAESLQPLSDEDRRLAASPPHASQLASETPPATPTPESAAGIDLFVKSLASGASTSQSAPCGSRKASEHDSGSYNQGGRRRRSESSAAAFERDDELLPPSTIAPDKRSFALDDLSTLSVFRVRPSSISANSPVYSSFEHPTPALAPSASFSGLPPSVAESFAVTTTTAHPPSRASSLEDINFADPIPTSGTSILTTVTTTPVPSGRPNSGGHPPESPPPFALPSSAASPQQYNVISDSDIASSFFTPDTSGSFLSSSASASTSFYTTGNVVFAATDAGDPLFRDPLPTRRNSESSNVRNSALGNLNVAPSPGRVSLSLGSATHPRSCDVYIGLFGKEPLLLRYAKWLHAELESRGVACFSADRSLYADQRSHDIARGIMHSAAFGVVLITRKSFRNPYTIEELTIFLDRGNLVPVFFDVTPPDCLVRDIVEKQGDIWEEDGGELWKAYMGEEKGWSEAVKGLLTVEEFRVEAYKCNWRESIQRVVAMVGTQLGVTDRRIQNDELPWPRNPYFAGREKELKIMEKVLFADPNPKSVEQGLPSRCSDASSRAETEDLESCRPSNYDGENNYEEIAWNAQTGSGLGSNKDAAAAAASAARRARRASREKQRRAGEPDRPKSYSSACTVTGIPGIGKSELALEFAFRHSQKYQMVLWVGGEARYLRQNYLNLSLRLGVNVSTTAETTQPRPRPFEDQESDAVAKIRYELQNDIPYLLIIDNLDNFDSRELSSLLPRAGSPTHIIITTRLPRVMHLVCLELPYLSSFEALTLMRDGKRSDRSFSVQQVDKFKEFEDKLRRLPFGIAIVGRLINEFNMKPSEILAKMGTIDTKRAASAIERDDVVLRGNPFLVKLLDVCFNLMGAKSLAVRMAYVGGWFGPAACPLALLALAAKKLEKDQGGKSIFTRCWWRSTTTEGDARDLLTRLGLARAATRSDYESLYFPDIVQVYCQKRGGVLAARAFVRAIRRNGDMVHQFEHFWAAAYLVCRYGSEPAVVELQVPDLLDFTRRLVMPLAIRAFNSFARCNAALEVMRLCFEMLEEVEKSYVAQIQDRWDRSLCWRRDANVPHQVDEYVWQDLTLLKALLLEARAKLLMRGGQYDAGEELCRTSISIRTVMQGADHPDTLAAQETLSKFVRNRNSSS